MEDDSFFIADMEINCIPSFSLKSGFYFIKYQFPFCSCFWYEKSIFVSIAGDMISLIVWIIGIILKRYDSLLFCTVFVSIGLNYSEQPYLTLLSSIQLHFFLKHVIKSFNGYFRRKYVRFVRHSIKIDEYHLPDVNSVDITTPWILQFRSNRCNFPRLFIWIFQDKIFLLLIIIFCVFVMHFVISFSHKIMELRILWPINIGLNSFVKYAFLWSERKSLEN